ncbi:glycosyltransferase N-terminal domain-containing protein [Candidatus Pelagibacter sp.]|jgi:3-deoxy-D-manno-octulosonic-acid transferase|nr:glycosyltransferase N-terminal domain-containing protein [Candidatus Pelagibacter sp.]
MFLIYQVLLTLIILISPLIIFIRVLKNKEDKKRVLEKFCLKSKKRAKGKLIWFHGSSVGEIMSIIPLVHYYEKEKSINKILITSSTLSSSKILDRFNLKKTIHQFYPIDHLLITRKFINYWKPCIAIFIDSEIWPSMFKTIRKREIPLILLNARITKKTFRRWIKFKNFSNSIFNNISSAYPQNKETESYLKKLKPNSINSLGNLKFIKNNLDNNNLDNLGLKFRNFKVWVAASTHKGEEIFCAKAHIKLKKTKKNLITVIIPRHINRVNEIISEMNKLNLKTVLHSSRIKNLENIDIYIVNTFGDSKKFYKIAATVFLGKSLTIKGGQNPLEAVHYNAKIIHGPYVDNFKDVYKLLKNLDASKKIKNIHQLALNISFKKNIKIGNKLKKTGKTILKKTINEINKFISDEVKKT